MIAHTSASDNIVSQNLIFYMNQKSVSRKQVCKDLNIKYTTFCDWINGKTEPKTESLEKLGNYFGISVADFFIDLNQVSDPTSRILKYAGINKELNMDVLENLSDDEIRNLLNAGFTFKRLSMEEYSVKFGRPIIASPDVDWGEPVEGETW